MTDNEIIQALEKSLQMGDAPIGAHWGVLLTTKLLSDSLDLIKRQRAEIELLKGLEIELLKGLEILLDDIPAGFDERSGAIE